jgi:hypothetical protein
MAEVSLKLPGILKSFGVSEIWATLAFLYANFLANTPPLVS